ncbi:Ktr system potassium transporter B [Hungatella hathewayi]|jgi:trk system potassium uptake protein|uniref:Potassium uptake protein, TrkH family n=3 Tax=Hungatella hathewayi TaxID=154046 RepID=D3AS24_9FIRM|nr:potassium uptake protein, TrkH family [Hungatella hathewayi DSM 13479]GKH03182.1 Ktr system potassium transporter B [Hungatella hathewayi]GKH08738.1 Ktr system potassium transporter B [Hungatella hathewayi]
MMTEHLRKLSPGRIVVLGFAFVILTGSLILWLPISANEGVDVSYIDALFTSTSAVCVTGLIAVDTADTFNVFGRTVVALLIQVGGLGVTCVGVGVILLAGKKIGIHGRVLIRDSMNLTTVKGVVRLVEAILFMTLLFEGAGALLSFLVFSKDYPPLDALGISVFHSVAAFNNSGFDILGGLKNLIPYQSNVLLNLTTCGLIIFGGLGFLVIREIWEKHSWRKFSLHTKVVIATTIALLAAGTVLLKMTEDITWLGALFQSTSARTAGFSTYPIGAFSNAGLFVLAVLMFLGASPGSTGGGIKTTTTFVLMKSMFSAATNRHCSAFKRRIPTEVVSQAFLIAILALAVVCVQTFLMCIAEPELDFMKLLFETVSAFGTVGLSTGITPDLNAGAKLILITTMFIGRLGPLTMATVWSFKPKAAAWYSEESITIG